MTFVRDPATLSYTLSIISTLLNDAIAGGYLSSYAIDVSRDDAHCEPEERALVHVAIFKDGAEVGSVILDDLDSPDVYPRSTAGQRALAGQTLILLLLESLWTSTNPPPSA